MPWSGTSRPVDGSKNSENLETSCPRKFKSELPLKNVGWKTTFLLRQIVSFQARTVKLTGSATIFLIFFLFETLS